jgi:hypothetical protein
LAAQLPGNTALQTKCAAPQIHTYTRQRRRATGEENTKCSFKHLYLLSIYFLSSQHIFIFVCLSLSTLTPSFLPYFYSQLILLLGVPPLQLEWSVAYMWRQSILPSAVCVCPVSTNFIDGLRSQSNYREGKKKFRS